MNPSEKYLKTISNSLILICLIAVSVVLIYGKGILVPFVLAIFLSFIITSLSDMLENKYSIPRVASISIVVGSFVVLFILFFLISSSSIQDLVSSGGKYKEKIIQFVVPFTEFANKYGFELNSENLIKTISNLPILNYIKLFSGEIFSFISNLAVVLLYLVFLVPGMNIKAMKSKTIHDIKNQISYYLSTKTALSFITAALVFAILIFGHVELAFMFGLFTFFLNFIPNIGSIVAILLPVPVIFIQFGFSIQSILIFTMLSLVQIVIGNVVEPKVMGDSLSLHPVTILFFLIFWGSVWGITGMFLAVPITSALKILLQKFSSTEKLAAMLEGRFTV